MKKVLVLAAAMALWGAVAARAEEGRTAPPAQALAEELAGEEKWEAAALEYRRLALEDAENAAAWRWMAAWAYAKSADARTRRRAEKQLDAAEDAEGAAEVAACIQALRAELAMGRGAYGEARFHFEGVERDAAGDEWAAWGRRGAAAAAARAGDEGRARAALADDPEGLEALGRAGAFQRKKPWVGGLLGMVPGMGYAYSGEWANALRSLLLNGLFAWAMAETAEDDEWALFGVCTFFEITWYSGSIYGGIDAAHRWNERRGAETERVLREAAGRPEPVMGMLPVLRVEFK